MPATVSGLLRAFSEKASGRTSPQDEAVLRRRVAATAVAGTISVLCVLVLAGCSASVRVQVAVEHSGGGSVTVTLALPEAEAAQVEDLQTGLPVSDLRRAGWVVSVARASGDGTTVVSAVHPFSRLSYLPVLMADVAGSGSISARPFRLSVSEGKGLLEDHFTATGTVDLTCSLDCFDNPALRGRLGYALGLPRSQLAELFGPDPQRSLRFSFLLSLPGSITRSNALAQSRGKSLTPWLAWSPTLGTATSLEATSKVVNAWFVRDVLVAIGAMAFLVAFTVTLLVRRARREPEEAGEA